jgi:PPOX class probable F420-dependent enzyme
MLGVREGAVMGAATGDSRYIALTTYRRDGRSVTTPVWAVALEGRHYVFTANSTGKAKRVRATLGGCASRPAA